MTTRRIATVRHSVLAVVGLGGLLLVASLPRLLADTQADRRGNGVTVLPVQTLTATKTDAFEVARQYTGQVVAGRSSNLGFEVAGRIVEISVEEGDRVEPDQELAKLTLISLNARRRELVALQDSAIATLDEMIAGPRVQTIDAAKSRVKELQARLKLFNDKRVRRERMFSEGAAPSEELSDAQREEEIAAAQLEAATHQLDELLAGTRKEKIRAQQATVAQLKAQIDQVDAAIGGSIIRAPYAGIISQRAVDEGAVVAEGQLVLRLVEDTALEARVGVPVSIATQLPLNSRQKIVIEDEEYDAEISAVLPELDGPTRTVTAVLALEPQTAGKVRSGQIVRLAVPETVKHSGFWLPTSALVKSVRGLWACYVLGEPADESAGTFAIEPRSVEVLHTEGDRVFVRGTLKDGDRVVQIGTHRIVSGQIVRPVTDVAGA